MKKDKIKVRGHIGTWYVIDSIKVMMKDDCQTEEVFLLEHEHYGEDAPHIVTDKNFNEIGEYENLIEFMSYFQRGDIVDWRVNQKTKEEKVDELYSHLEQSIALSTELFGWDDEKTQRLHDMFSELQKSME